MNEEGRRYKLLSITPELVMLLGRGKFQVEANELPPDAHVAGAYYDSMRHVFVVIVESQEFEIVPYSDTQQVIPRLPSPQIHRLE